MTSIFDVKSIEELDIFIRKGGDIHELRQEVNALFYENAQKDIKLFNALIEKGVDCKLYNSDNENITHFILYPHIVPIVAKWAKWANFNEDYPELDILTVAYAHAPTILKELIRHGLNIECESSEYEETIAFHHNIPDETALFLRENHLNVFKKNIDGQNMLFHTTSLILAQYAIEKGLSVNDVDEYSNTAIMINENDDIVKLLIRNGADIRHINDQNENILLSRYNNLDMLKFLVKEGVDIHFKSSKGSNALTQCLETEEAQFLMDQGVKISNNDSLYQNDEIKNFVLVQHEKKILSGDLSETTENIVKLRI